MLDKAADSLKDWQSQYGANWKSIVDHPAFRAGMQYLNIQKLEKIMSLQDEDIEKNGREILADLRGHLQHEIDLFTLHERKEFTLPFDEPDEYFSPEQVGEIEKLKTRLREQTQRSRYA